MNPFDAVAEQSHVRQALEKAILKKTVNHAYLFNGAAGIGKKTTAVAFAKALLSQGETKNNVTQERIDHGNHPDFVKIEAGKDSATIKISAIRQLIDVLSVRPYSSEYRVILIADGDAMTVEAQNALLKSLEEPEAYNVFILTTANISGLLPTIVSRCQRMDFEPVSRSGAERILTGLGYEPEQISRVMNDSDGSPGKLIQMLEDDALAPLKEQCLRTLLEIYAGNKTGVFPLAEILAEDKMRSETMIDFMIDFTTRMAAYLHGAAEPGDPNAERYESFTRLVTPEQLINTQRALWKIKERMDYNINLKLQWEGALLTIGD